MPTETDPLLTDLIAARDRAGLSNADLERATGIGRPNIVRTLSGRAALTLGTARKLAEAVGLRLALVPERAARGK